MKNSLIFTAFSLALLTSCKQITPPEPVLPIPSEKQIAWQKLEQYAFVHFGLNTFNDLEWGYGDTPVSTFNPTNLDCDQWARTIKAAGLKGIMLTAKHHDGFCLWPSKYTEYSVKNAPWKNGKGDMVRELSDACKKYDLKFGIYLSPWDRNHAEYGRDEYVTYFHNQMEELLSNYGDLFEYWFDGANGGDGFYGGAKERRSINAKTYYNYKKARETINRLQPNAVIFGGTCADIRWIGNESGFAGETNWSTIHTDHVNKEDLFTEGEVNGEVWLPGESDVSIRPGWFYHPREDFQVHSLQHLVNIYYETVGRNSNLILNFPVALNGKIHPIDSARIMEWRKVLDEDFKENLLLKAKAEATNVRGNASSFKASNVTDGDWDTYWATDDSVTDGTITLSFPEKKNCNRLLIQEYIPLGQRIFKFSIEYEKDGNWIPIETKDKMTTIGYKRIIRFNTVKTTGFRIVFEEAKGPLCINNIEAFMAPALLVEPSIQRNENNQVSIQTTSNDIILYYTIDGSEPNTQSLHYEGPFTFAEKATIKAIAFDPISKKQSTISTKILDVPCSSFTIKDLKKWAGNDSKVMEKLSAQTKFLFDGNANNSFYIPKDKPQEITIDLDNNYLLSGFTYTPDKSRWGGSAIAKYEFYVDGKKVSEGEFSNIKNNPIEQRINFTPIKGKQIRLVSLTRADGSSQTSISEFSILTAN